MTRNLRMNSRCCLCGEPVIESRLRVVGLCASCVFNSFPVCIVSGCSSWTCPECPPFCDRHAQAYELFSVPALMMELRARAESGGRLPAFQNGLRGCPEGRPGRSAAGGLR